MDTSETLKVELDKSQGMVRDLLQLVQKLLMRLAAYEKPKPGPKRKEPAEPPEYQLSDYERELRQIQRDFGYMGLRDAYPSDTLYTSDGRQVPVRRQGKAFWL